MYYYIGTKSVVFEIVDILRVELRLRLWLLGSDLTLFDYGFLRQRQIFGDLQFISDLNLVNKTLKIAKITSKLFENPCRMKI